MQAHRIALTVAAAGALLVSGCGGSAATSTAEAKPLPSYLARYPRARPVAVYFIQWQQSGESVDGTLTIVPAGATTAAASTQDVTGTVDGRRVELDVGPDPAQRWTGELRGPAMVMSVALENGPAQTLTFTRASLAGFKRAVAKLQG
jgi:hypothetical protein